MVNIIEFDNLSYHKFNDISLSFEKGLFYLIVGSNNSGKTTLFRIISSIIPTENTIICNNIILNDNNLMEYITNIGVVERVNNNSFIYQKVYDEMRYPLVNLGYSKKNIDKRISEILKLFKEEDILDKNISDLTYSKKQKLLIMISLLHQPNVLLIDSVLEIFDNYEKENILKILSKLVKDGLTIINFTVSLNDINYCDRIVLLDDFKVIGEYLPKDVFLNDKVFYEHHIEIPFIIDLSVKLKM